MAVLVLPADGTAAVARSVASVLAQSEPAVDVLLVGGEEAPRDAGPGDPRLRSRTVPGATHGAMLHAALEGARAPYVCLLRAGDVLDADAIFRHVDAIEAYPPPAATLARVAPRGTEDGTPAPAPSEPAPTRGRALHATLRGAPPPLGASLVRRDLALAAG
ncbi:MAG: hypothetical protein AB1689_29620, partial [Thermodesulfobacteriota bacterium]